MPNEQIIAALVGVIGLMGGGGLTYLGNRLARSGDVKTTSADKLWESYGTLLNAYVNDNGQLRESVTRLQVESHNLELRAQASANREAECDRRNVQLTADVAQMAENLENLRRQVVDTATAAAE